jgi:hypothetical protein
MRENGVIVEKKDRGFIIGVTGISTRAFTSVCIFSFRS